MVVVLTTWPTSETVVSTIGATVFTVTTWVASPIWSVASRVARCATRSSTSDMTNGRKPAMENVTE